MECSFEDSALVKINFITAFTSIDVSFELCADLLPITFIITRSNERSFFSLQTFHYSYSLQFKQKKCES